MTQVLTAAQARALLGGKKALPASPTPRTPRHPTKDTDTPREGPTEAQIQKRKDAARRREEAELSRLNQQSTARFQLGAGESTLGTVKVFHLTPIQQSELVEFLQINLKATRA